MHVTKGVRILEICCSTSVPRQYVDNQAQYICESFKKLVTFLLTDLGIFGVAKIRTGK